MPTRDELLARFRLDRALKSTTLITDANAVILFNEGALQLANDGDAFILKATWSGVASTQEYILSGASPKVTGFLDLYLPAGGLVYLQTSSVTKMMPDHFKLVSESWLDLRVPGWRDASASDTLQYIYLTYDASGYLNLGVYPKTSTTTPTFKLYYKSRGTDMSAGGNYPWTNSTTILTHTEPFQIGIMYYAAWKAHETFTLNQAMALYYKTAYLEQALGLRDAQRRVVTAEIDGLMHDAQIDASDSFGGL